MLLGKKLRGDGCGGIVLTFDDDLKSVAEEKTGQTTEAKGGARGLENAVSWEGRTDNLQNRLALGRTFRR